MYPLDVGSVKAPLVVLHIEMQHPLMERNSMQSLEPKTSKQPKISYHVRAPLDQKLKLSQTGTNNAYQTVQQQTLEGKKKKIETQHSSFKNIRISKLFSLINGKGFRKSRSIT